MYSTINIISGGIVGLLAAVLILLSVFHRRTYVLNKKYFQRQWTKLQKLCSNQKLWYQAIVDADELVDEALKQLHFKGKTPGERLVAAQRYFTSNDALWYSHKLKNRIVDDNLHKLSKRQTLDALASFRLALKDLGALNAERKANSKNER